ncbi:hypothetical protein RLOatenuis_0840 [Rickettsiales bacterium]|nr:hypothetical protein RLOatenuis_0840 [Rickettsiales bacterium]
MILKTYAVYLKSRAEPENAIFIKEGFRWLAFIFNVFWLLYNKIWSAGFLMLAIIIGSSFLEEYVSDLSSWVWLILAFYVGFCGADMLQSQLKKRKFEFITTVQAQSTDDASKRFYDKYGESLYKSDETSEE